MNGRNRREFLADVGRGMLVAGIGPALAMDMGVAPAWAGEDGDALEFGRLEPLVGHMQETPIEALQPWLVRQLARGTDLRTLIAAGALANTRTFGGQDYTGFHTLMALAPAYHMAEALPESQRALPIFKVLYRNTARMQQFGGREREVLHPVQPLDSVTGGGRALQAATRSADFERAERTFATLAAGPPNEAFNDLQYSVQDEVDVHRVVLAWRAWTLLDFAGADNAHTLLRQSVRYCVKAEQERRERGRSEPAIRALLPRLFDQYKLIEKPMGQRRIADEEVERLARDFYGQDRERAAETAAAALADGIAADDVGEALALASNWLVLHDPGRQRASGDDKPVGSVHGASVGVHASDSANAWWNISQVGSCRNTLANLITGAYHTAGQSQGQLERPYPFPEQVEAVTASEPRSLLEELDACIRASDQARASAVTHRYGQFGHPPRPLLDVLLRYGTSQDGALHAEKYYQTVNEEFARMRPAFRWNQLVALARVTASEYGHPAPGFEEARRLLNVT